MPFEKSAEVAGVRTSGTPSIVTPDQHIADLFELAVESPLPVAVTDEQDRLIGVVPRVTLLAALADLPAITTEIPIIEPTPEVPAATITRTLAGDGPGREPEPRIDSVEGTR